MEEIKWQARTSGKSVFKIYVNLGKNKNEITISIFSKRAARWIIDERQLRRCVKFETPFQLIENYAVIGFQPETGYMTTVRNYCV